MLDHSQGSAQTASDNSGKDYRLKQFEGKLAIVTGAARGIGRGIAQVLAERGATVALGDIDESGVAAVADDIQAMGGTAMSGFADIADAESIGRFAEQVVDDFGSVDICVPNAGVIGVPDFESRIGHVEADWNATWNINVMGTVNTISAVRDHMQEQRHGKIVIVSSQGGRPPAGSGGMWGGTVQQPYLISKSALIQYMHHLAIEMGPFNVNVNAVCPGTLWTPMWEKIAANHAVVNPELAGLEPREFFARTVKANIPLQRAPTAVDVGSAVAFLASEDASEITGQALNVNGGAVMS